MNGLGFGSTVKSKAIIATLAIGLFYVSSGASTFVPACINTYISSGKYGERFFLDSTNRHKGIVNPSRLRIYSQNFENLGKFTEVSRVRQMVDGILKKVKVERTIEKSHGQNLRMAVRIQKQNPDIIVGMEVKDIEAAQHFSKEYLNDQYQAILIEGNDKRGIDVCFFVKRTLNLDFEVESYKKYSLTSSPNDPVFSRDFPQLLVRPAGASKSSKPIMAIFGAHLKSRMGQAGPVDKTAFKRAEQVLASLQIMAELEKKYSGVPIVLAGDLNNDVRTAPELSGFFKAGFADAMDFDKQRSPDEDRDTQYFFKYDESTPDPFDSTLVLSQLDAMLVNAQFGRYILAAGIQRDLRPDGSETGMPTKVEHVNKRASDHDGLFLVVDFNAMIDRLSL